MEQYNNLRGAMETINHSRCGACQKRQTNRGYLVSRLMLLSLTLFVSIGAWGQTSAIIENVWEDFNVNENNQGGMRIHLKFSVNDMLKKKGLCAVYFYLPDGTKLKDYNSLYTTSEGQVATCVIFKPRYSSVVYSDFNMFIPYDELHLAVGQHSLKYNIEIRDNNSKSIAISEYRNFSINQISTNTFSQPTFSQPTISQPTISQPTITQPVISQPTVDCAALQRNYTKFKKESADCERRRQQALASGNYVTASGYVNTINKWNSMIRDVESQARRAGCSLY